MFTHRARAVAVMSATVFCCACARTKLVSTCPPRTPLPTITVTSTNVEHGAVLGVIVGHVLHRAVEFARVDLEPSERSALSDIMGAFRFDSVPAGRYVLRVRRVGYDARRDSIDVPPAGVRIAVQLNEVVFDGGCLNPVTHRERSVALDARTF